jgi:hypothetical protein
MPADKMVALDSLAKDTHTDMHGVSFAQGTSEKSVPEDLSRAISTVFGQNIDQY